MKYVVMFPLFGILLIIYNFFMLGDNPFVTNPDLIKIPLMANDDAFYLKASDIFVMFGVIILYFEILKATRYSRSTIIDHVGSMIVFVICLIEFIVVAGAGTSTFMILTMMSLLDVVAGFTVTIATARRDIAFGGQDGVM